MGFIEQYINGDSIDYIAKTNLCQTSEIQEALKHAIGISLDEVPKKITSNTGLYILYRRHKYKTIHQIAKELGVSIPFLKHREITKLKKEDSKIKKYHVIENADINICPCCKTTNGQRDIILPESEGVQGIGHSQGVYCSNCETEYIIKGDTINILNWEFVQRSYT